MLSLSHIQGGGGGGVCHWRGEGIGKVTTRGMTTFGSESAVKLLPMRTIGCLR